MAIKDKNGNDFFEQDLDAMLQEYLAKEEAEKQRKEQALLESSHTAQMNLADVNRLLSEMNLNDLFSNEATADPPEDEHDLDVILRAYGDENRNQPQDPTRVLSPRQAPEPLLTQEQDFPADEKTRVFSEEKPAPAAAEQAPSTDPLLASLELEEAIPSPPSTPSVSPAPAESMEPPRKKTVVTPVLEIPPRNTPAKALDPDPPPAPISPAAPPKPGGKVKKKPLESHAVDLSATTTIPTGLLNDNIYDTQVVPDLPDAMKQIKPHKRSRFSFRDPQPENADAPARSGLYVSLGIIMTVLALIGIVGLSLLAIQGVQKKMNQTQVKQEWNQQVFPLVASDVPDFDLNAGQVPSDNAVLAAGIWAFILSDSNANYETNEQGMLTVPALDIELHVKKIFGPEISFTHQSLQEPILQVEYRPLDDIGKGVYLIPATPPTIPYRPNTIEVVEENATSYLITVSYMRPMPLVSDEELFKTGEVLKTKQFSYTKTSENDRFVTRVAPSP